MFISIQLLRVIACSLVLFSHIDPYLVSSLNRKFSGGGIGVDIFFIISGFVMAAATSKTDMGIHSALSFFIKRIIRIWPMYAIITVVFAYEMNYLKFEYIDLPYIIDSLLMLPVSIHNSMYGDIFIDPKLGVGWTLQFEMFFYFVISILIILKIRKPYIPALIFAVPILFNLRPVALSPFFSMVSCPILFEFAFGYWIYSVYCKYPSAFQLAAPMLIPTGSALIVIAMTGDWSQWYHNTPRMIVRFGDVNLHRAIAWGVPSAILFCGVLGCEEWIKKSGVISRISVMIGDATYSLYLTHILVFQWMLRHIPTYPTSSIFIYIVTPFIVALIVHFLIEKPITKILNDIASKKIRLPLKSKIA
ncbi:acyltransferase [Kosakonia sp. ML.JS2a]|uniref:acyltransferase family protein n=1 Tax=Kosakonia sp. ML.JS2a TaxID=2980557 RepID=UPI0021D90FA5|nr:acyltransferase [Kosakonia sp. ML.JS2a]UXY12087.1 acyltransferase [Kosakonia sp. ML.JS2a]